MKSLLVTGGAGFIGSNFVRYMWKHHPEVRLTVLDKFTYAGNMDNLADTFNRVKIIEGDIGNGDYVLAVMEMSSIDAVVNFAAESHVDRSIIDPSAFMKTNAYGAYVLLEKCRQHGVERFVQVSTDEVYGSVPVGFSTEDANFRPNSPYAVSKAAADLMTLAYYTTFGMNVGVTRGSNTFGPNQYPEKLLPLFITNAIEDKPLPMYGDGMQVRDWLDVEDHCAGIAAVLINGAPGEAYNLGGGNELHNIDVIRALLKVMDKPESLIVSVEDRPGHDYRYALNSTKALTQLGWKPQFTFQESLEKTVAWYVANEGWWRKLKSGEFMTYYQRQYGSRLA